jgi:hypothetical protein
MQVRASVELAEEFEQRAFAEAMDLPRQADEALAGNQASALRLRSVAAKFGVVEPPPKLLNWKVVARVTRWAAFRYFGAWLMRPFWASASSS